MALHSSNPWQPRDLRRSREVITETSHMFPSINTDINGILMVYHLSIVNGYIGSIYIYIYHLRIVNISGYQWYTTHFRIEISERPTIFLWNGLYTIWECGSDGSSWQVAIWCNLVKCAQKIGEFLTGYLFWVPPMFHDPQTSGQPTSSAEMRCCTVGQSKAPHKERNSACCKRNRRWESDLITHNIAWLHLIHIYIYCLLVAYIDHVEAVEG